MARNNSNVLVPKFLDMEKARALNNNVYKNTGCFLFVTLPEEKLLSPQPNSGGGGNYASNVINLYKMYNDYGHFFLWFTIQESQIPQDYMINSPDPVVTGAITSLKQSQSRVREHYNFVARVARHVLAHGIFQQFSMLTPYCDPKIKSLENAFEKILSGKIWPDSEKDWKAISRWLVEESDFMYEWINQWAEIWKHCTTEINELKTKFYYGRWDYSKNKDVCYSTNKDSFLVKEYEGKKYFLFDDRDENLSSFARVFPFQHILDTKEYLVAAAPSISRSEYDENGFWRSDRPDERLKNLFININYYGVENVRSKMLQPMKTSSTCPDAFKLYLEGLTKKMISLPVINTKPKKSSKFRR